MDRVVDFNHNPLVQLPVALAHSYCPARSALDGQGLSGQKGMSPLVNFEWVYTYFWKRKYCWKMEWAGIVFAAPGT